MSFSTVALLTLLSSSLFTSVRAQSYILEDLYQGATFFNGFDFFTAADPTHGFVNYVSQAAAAAGGLISATSSGVYMGVDYNTTLSPSSSVGRKSVRIVSQNSYTEALIIGDFSHMPGGQCGTWPAFWTVGPNWPYDGEIDIVEGVNSGTTNLMSMHTGTNCTLSGSGQTGTLQTNDCYQYSSSEDNTGCGTSDTRTNSYGAGFDAAKGGVYAVEWTSSHIRIWFWSRNAVPSDITNGTPTPSGWGTPDVNLGGTCNIPNHFQQHQIVFDTTFCGDWAGPAFLTDATCKSLASTCVDYVAQNPSAFVNAYWEINYVAVYQLNGNASTSTSTPATTSTRATSTSTATVHATTTASTTTTPASSATATSTAVSCPNSNSITTTVGGTSFVVECSLDHPGGDMAQQTTSSFSACLALCASTAGCVDVSWAPGSTYCYMKKTLAAGSANTKVWGGRVVGSSTNTSTSTIASSSKKSSTTTSSSAKSSTSASSTSTKRTSSSSTSTSSKATSLAKTSSLPSSPVRSSSATSSPTRKTNKKVVYAA